MIPPVKSLIYKKEKHLRLSHVSMMMMIVEGDYHPSPWCWRLSHVSIMMMMMTIVEGDYHHGVGDYHPSPWCWRLWIKWQRDSSINLLLAAQPFSHWIRRLLIKHGATAVLLIIIFPTLITLLETSFHSIQA